MAKEELLNYANQVINAMYENKKVRENEVKIIETKSDLVMLSTNGITTIINAQSLKIAPSELAESISFASNQVKELVQKESRS